MEFTEAEHCSIGGRLLDTELLKIFDPEGNEIGTATRKEVHQKGLWHETFQCWLVEQGKDKDFIYFQWRSHMKKDYPNLLDITAAGHLLANETPKDGLREIREELGIEIQFDEMISLGIIHNSIQTEKMIDNEFSHVFLYKIKHPALEFKPQKEEVTGIVKADVRSFLDFCHGKSAEIWIEGYCMNSDCYKISIGRYADKTDFVPHEDAYLKTVAKLISDELKDSE